MTNLSEIFIGRYPGYRANNLHLAAKIKGSLSHLVDLETRSTLGESLAHLIAKILQMLLSKECFCWLSRFTIQLQSIIRPRKWSYWTKLSDTMYLGAMPLKNWGHLDQITQLGIGAILSINEEHELLPQLFAQPVTNRDWKCKKISYLRLSSSDLAPLAVSTLAKAVNYVVEQIYLGKRVYMHCVGGRGRSVSVAIGSWAKLNGCSLGEAIRYVKKCRPQAALSKQQRAALFEWGNRELDSDRIQRTDGYRLTDCHLAN